MEYRELLNTTFNRRRALGVGAGSLAGAAVLTAFGAAGVAQAAPLPSTNLYLTLISDAMTGQQNWPVYVPSDLTVPAYSVINARIVQFDQGTGELPGGSPFATVTGVTGGWAKMSPITQTDPNHLGDPSGYEGLNAGDVAHTFTIGGLGINVPLPASSVVEFSFQSGGPGNHNFQCMVDCGTGPQGIEGTMATLGYMIGTMHVI